MPGFIIFDEFSPSCGFSGTTAKQNLAPTGPLLIKHTIDNISVLVLAN